MVTHRPTGAIRPQATSRNVNVEKGSRKMGETAVEIGVERPRRTQMMSEIGKPRQEICGPLKWICFIVNFFIFLGSVGCLALGVYLFLTDLRPIGEPVDVFLNPAVLLTSAGFVSGTVALLGLFGALRDNVCLLKLFALFVFLSYLVLVVFTCFLFLLFYSDTTGDEKGISAQYVLHYSIRRYHTNRNVADFVDYMQEQLECCGSTSFRDWNLSEQFKCNSSNPYPERCGIPFSCCRRSVAGGANGGQNPLAPAIRSLQCWQNAQKKREQQLDSDIYVAGCLQPLRTLFDDHALHIGLGVVSVILPVCMAVFLSQCLARQIDYQRFLLRREERRTARAERREQRFREQHQQQQQDQRKRESVSSQSELANGHGHQLEFSGTMTQIINTEKENSRRRRIHQRQKRTKSSSPLTMRAVKVRDAKEKRRSMDVENGGAMTEMKNGRGMMEDGRKNGRGMMEDGRKNGRGMMEDGRKNGRGMMEDGRKNGRGMMEDGRKNGRGMMEDGRKNGRGMMEDGRKNGRGMMEDGRKNGRGMMEDGRKNGRGMMEDGRKNGRGMMEDGRKNGRGMMEDGRKNGRGMMEDGRKNGRGMMEDGRKNGRGMMEDGRTRSPVKKRKKAEEEERKSKSPQKNGKREEAIPRKALAMEPTAPSMPSYFTLQQAHFS
uniref:Tetraspanin n=1 Tax=Globodera rostochiensis TaxID=31243 RepID=A0A914IAJ9_GLORO